MKKLFKAFLALILLASLSACSSSSSASSAENSKETEKTDTPASTEENNNELGYTFENPYFIVRFTEQEIDEEEGLLLVGYTVENLSDQAVYVKYGAWKKPADPADPAKTAHTAFDHSNPDFDGRWAVSLWSSPAEEANQEDRLGNWIFKFTFDEAGYITDIADEGWMFEGNTPNSSPVQEYSGPAEYEFVCDDPGFVINRCMSPYEEGDYICITVDFTNNTNYAIRDTNPGESHSYTLTSVEPYTLDSLEVGDSVDIELECWTTENSDGKGGGAPVEVHAYLVRTK